MEKTKIEETLLYFSLKYNGDGIKIMQALQNKESINLFEKERLIKQVKSNYTTILSKDYPKQLKDIYMPPFVLFYYGDLSLVCNKTIGVIGMRKPSYYGQSVADQFVCDLVKNKYTIVSGMALGIDTIAHRSAMHNHGKTIAILGSGIDYCYPKQNRVIYDLMKNDHLIISEYPGLLIPHRNNFPKRNRIIAALSNQLLVIEAKQKSGTLITVGHALDQGKDIFCIPSNIDGNTGCNILIQQGAKLINCIEDILNE